MSLRSRLLAAIALALLISFAASLTVFGWYAARSVRIELAAALANARDSASASLGDLPNAASGVVELRQIVHAFDGSRHIRAELTNAAGHVDTVSHTAPGGSPPEWFLSATAPALAPVILPVPGVPGLAALTLRADPRNEVSERWAEAGRSVALLALFSALSAGLCVLTASRGLRPLTSLLQGLTRLRDGEQEIHLPRAGPPEIAALAGAFNTLASALRHSTGHNQRLEAQIALLAEEERAEIARDLHDEIGPLLFAIAAFTAAASRQLAEGKLSDIPPQLSAIQDATAAMQLQVRDLLGRLHDEAEPCRSLHGALQGMVDFWRKVRPDVAFDVRIEFDDTGLTEPLREALFRVAQEATSNAVRHGKPQRVSIVARQECDRTVVQVSDDGSGGHEGAGFGLGFMRARIAALGGELDITRGHGWVVTAKLKSGAAA